MALLRVVSRGNESLWNIILKEAKLSERDCKSLGKDCEKKAKKSLTIIRIISIEQKLFVESFSMLNFMRKAAIRKALFLNKMLKNV